MRNSQWVSRRGGPHGRPGGCGAPTRELSSGSRQPPSIHTCILVLMVSRGYRGPQNPNPASAPETKQTGSDGLSPGFVRAALVPCFPRHGRSARVRALVVGDGRNAETRGKAKSSWKTRREWRWKTAKSEPERDLHRPFLERYYPVALVVDHCAIGTNKDRQGQTQVPCQRCAVPTSKTAK